MKVVPFFPPAMAQEFVDALIKDNKVVVFSKSYCGYCRTAKSTLASAGLKDYKVIELDVECGESCTFVSVC